MAVPYPRRLLRKFNGLGASAVKSISTVVNQCILNVSLITPAVDRPRHYVDLAMGRAEVLSINGSVCVRGGTIQKLQHSFAGAISAPVRAPYLARAYRNRE